MMFRYHGRDLRMAQSVRFIHTAVEPGQEGLMRIEVVPVWRLMIDVRSMAKEYEDV